MIPTLAREENLPEWFSSVALLTWGAVCVAAPQRLTHPLYRVLIDVIPANAVGYCVFVVGLIQVCAMLCDIRAMRAAAAGVAASMHSLVFWSQLVPLFDRPPLVWPSSGLGYFAGFGVLNLVAMSRNIRGRT